MNDLPPRYYRKPSSLPRFILSLVTLFIMLLAIPIGVYLVGQRTHFLPQAEVARSQPVEIGDSGFTIRQLPNQASQSGQLIVDVLARSDTAAANLFATRVSFPVQKLEVLSVATSSADLKEQKLIAGKWIESSFDNQRGQVNLIAGDANPGIKTEPKIEYLLARMIFKVKMGGVITFHLDPDSAIFQNQNNTKLDIRKNDLTIDLPAQAVPCQDRPACLDSHPACKIVESEGGWCPKPSTTPAPRFIQFVKKPASLTLISPQGGETISLNSATQIRWGAEGLDKISINLLMNGQTLGRIASPSAALGKFSWKVADTILPAYLTPTTTFQIEIEGQTAAGESLKDQSRGPFAIVLKDLNLEASQAANLAQRGGDGNHDGIIGLTDLSIILSSFGKQTNLDLGVDLNGDGVVNDVDLWLFKGMLLK